jgi:hypothetical protein
LTGHREARVIGFPLLIVPFAIYHMIAFLMQDVSWSAALYLMPVPLKSGVAWTGTLSDAFLAFSLLMLMFEFIKSARHGKSLVEHFLSLLLAGGAAAEFWMLPQFGTSTFLLFVVICFVDMFAGFAASLRRARRAVVVPEPVPVQPARVEPARVEPARAEAVRAEPARVEPAHPFTTAPPMPRAEPVIIEPAQKSGT